MSHTLFFIRPKFTFSLISNHLFIPTGTTSELHVMSSIRYRDESKDATEEEIGNVGVGVGIGVGLKGDSGRGGDGGGGKGGLEGSASRSKLAKLAPVKGSR